MLFVEFGSGSLCSFKSFMIGDSPGISVQYKLVVVPGLLDFKWE